MSNRRRPIILAVLSVLPIVSIAASLEAQSIYTGPNNGDWNTPGNWSLGVPGAALDGRVNNNASNVVVNLANGQAGAAQTLTIDTGDSVQIGNNSNLNLAGNLVVNGTLKFLGTTSDSYLRFSSPTSTISGSGAIDLNLAAGGGQARLEGPSSGTLTNTSTIRGSGYLYESRFTNAVGGVLENYQTTGNLYLDSNNGAPGSFVNRGTIRALAGSLVTFTGDFGGDFDSVGGNIQANGAGAIVRFFNSASVTGGTYSTSGGGEIVVEAGHVGYASAFTNAGTFRIRNNARLNVSGTINNTGDLIVDAGANEAYLSITGATTLSGAGTTRLFGTVGGGSAHIDGSGTLTIAAGHTVRGEGYFYEMRVVNNGTIIGDSSSTPMGGTYLDANNAGPGLFVNNGTIQVTAGNYLSLVGDFGGDFTGGGTYRADGVNAFMHLANNVTVNGGLYTTSAGGEIRVPVSHVARINSPTLTAGSTFAVLNNARLYVNGTVTNNGSLDVRAGVNETYLSIESATTLAGSGTVSLTSSPGGANARIDGSGLLTISPTATVSGNGYFYEMRVANNGLILADRATGAMTLDPNNAAADLFVNSGTIKASAGASLNLVGDYGGNFSGNGSYLADGANAVINIVNGVLIKNGTFTTTNGGKIQVPASQTATLRDSTISANSTLTVANNARLYLEGTPTINGVLQVTAGANETYLSIAGTTNLNTGTLSLTSNPAVANARIDGAGTLNIGANFTVSGNGYFYEMRVNNAGTIVADRATGAMTLDSSNAAANLFVNTGTIKAAAGATLNLTGDYGGNFSGAGTYRADGANAALQLINNVSVNGGTYTTTAGGRIVLPESQTATIDSATLSAGSLFATLSNSRLYLSGTLTNAGTLSVTAAANETYLSIPGNVTIAGAGTTRLASNPGVSNARIDGAGTLTIASGHTLAGNGYLYEMRVINNGTILADQAAGAMTLDPSSAGANLFVNNGTIRAAAGATINLTGDYGGNFSGAGAYVADGTIQAINSLGGDLVTDITGSGTYRAANSSNLGVRSFKVAKLEATSSGTARVTAGGGNAGTSKVTAITVDVPSNGRVDVTDHGIVVDYTGATPAATIRGYLANGRNNGNWNGAGIMSSLANASNGRAVGYRDTAGGAGGTFLGQSYDATSILIRFTVNGDTNLDGVVDFADLVSLAQAYNLPNKVWTDGDFNYDGTVDFTDLVPLAQNYNKSLPLTDAGLSELTALGGSGFAADWALAQSLAPEPTTLAMFAGVAAMVVRRQRLA